MSGKDKNKAKEKDMIVMLPQLQHFVKNITIILFQGK